MGRWPSYVIYIVSIIFKWIQRPILFHTPQLHSPIKRWCQEQVREVNCTLNCMSWHTSNRALMSLVCLSYTCLRAVTACYEHINLDVSIVTMLHISIPGTRKSISPVYTEPSSLPTIKLLTSAWGKARHVTAIGLLCLCCSSSVSWGCDSMSRFHEHSRPSVDTLIKLWAFWVPTTLRQYTGCCNREKSVCSSFPCCTDTINICWHEYFGVLRCNSVSLGEKYLFFFNGPWRQRHYNASECLQLLT